MRNEKRMREEYDAECSSGDRLINNDNKEEENKRS